MNAWYHKAKSVAVRGMKKMLTVKYEERRPISDKLKPYVKCIWTLQRSYTEDDSDQFLWPDGCKEIIFHYGITFRKDGKPLPTSFVMGTYSGCFHLHARGDLLLYGVRLHSWGLIAFTEKPVKQFNDRCIPAVQFFPERAAAALAKLEQSIAATRDLPDAQHQLEAFLSAQITAQKISPRLMAALQRLCETPEQYDVVSAARDTGLSLRQFERQCIKLTGLAPKRLHRISRFNQVRIRLLTQPDADLLDCMVEAGYYDYSHFSRDFKACIGFTPHQFKVWAVKS